MVASAALAAYLAWRSLGWPLVHDAPLMHYVAWLIANGAVPYRDVFDMNLPGVYLLHLAALEWGDPGSLVWRVFDLGWLAATCALLFAYCRPLTDAWGAAAAAMLFAVFHLSGGAWRVGQRDFLLCVFLLGGAYGTARAVEDRDGWPLLWAGLALGAGMTIKPHAGLFWLACAAVAGWQWRRNNLPAWRAVGSLLAAGLVVPALVFGWLAWRGGLDAFVTILVDYVLPLYSRMGRVPPWEAVRSYPLGWQLWLLLLVLGALAVLSPVPRELATRRGLAVLGAAYGALHFALQGKGWEYQLYPLALFLCALAAVTVVPDPDGSPRLRFAWASRRPLALVLWALLLLVLGVKGVDALEASWIARKVDRVAALTRDLGPLVPPGGTVQVLDTTAGGIHALLNLRLRQPTRFIYDFHFFQDAQDPRIRALRGELVAGLGARRPACIVVLRDSWPRESYERLAGFPELLELLDRSYTLAVEGDGYRIYAKRADS